MKAKFKSVRQKRWKTASDCTLTMESKKYSIVDFSEFGIGFISKIPFEIDQKISAEIELQGKKFGPYDFSVSRIEDTCSENKIVGISILKDCSIPVSSISGISMAEAIISESLSSASVIDPQFEIQVNKLKESFSNIFNKIKGIEDQHYIESDLEKTKDFEDNFTDHIAQRLSGFLPSELKKLYTSIKQMPEEKREFHKNYFREELGEFFFSSPFSKRSFNKPLGYAGDYQMMQIIYNSDQIEGDLVTQCLQKLYLSHPNAKAVRNRRVLMKEKILEAAGKNDECFVLSVACGPAREIADLVESQDQSVLDKLRIFLLDQDENALEQAQRNIYMAQRLNDKSVQVNFLNKNIKDILTDSLVSANFNLIYSAGLFDYFNDKSATAFAKSLYEYLAPNGRLVIGNFKSVEENQALMELVLDWYLIYRSPDDMKRIFEGFSDSLELEQEKEGINLFAVIGKN